MQESATESRISALRGDVVIVGGGFTGAAAACALADGVRRVIVLEARVGRDPRFRGELLHPPGAQALSRLGLLDLLRAAGGVDVKGFAVFATPGESATELPYDAVEGGASHGFAMDHHHMVDVMRKEAMRRPGVEFHFGQRVTEVIREAGRVVGVRTAAGLEVRAAISIVAEGRLSRLRGELGLEDSNLLLSYSIALLARNRPLPVPHHGHVVLGPPGPLLAYPIGEGVRFCIDVPADTDRGRAAIEARLLREYAPLLPPLLRENMELGIADGTFELCASQQVRTHQCVVPGAALVGDAGGCSHPLTAAGMTSSLHDIQTLVDVLNDVSLRAGRPAIDQSLLEYQKRRYQYVRAREVLTEQLYEVFLGADPGTRALRDGVLRYWQTSPRARAASLALLSGQRSTVGAFLGEFANVLFHATRNVATSEMRGNVRGGMSTMGAMLRTTATKFRKAGSTVLREWMR